MARNCRRKAELAAFANENAIAPIEVNQIVGSHGSYFSPFEEDMVTGTGKDMKKRDRKTNRERERDRDRESPL